jgi:hypothetical protein
MYRTTKGIIGLLGLIAIAVVVTALIRRERHAIAIEEALARNLEPGMRLNEATELLRRLQVPFTVDTSVEGTALIRYGREETHDGRISRVSEQQLVFDREGRLRDMLGAVQISSP